MSQPVVCFLHTDENRACPLCGTSVPGRVVHDENDPWGGPEWRPRVDHDVVCPNNKRPPLLLLSMAGNSQPLLPEE